MKQNRIFLAGRVGFLGLAALSLAATSLPLHAGLFSKDEPAKTSDAASTAPPAADAAASKGAALVATPSFAPIVKKVAPAVVTISTTKNVKEAPMAAFPFANDPFFRQFFGGQIPGNGDGGGANGAQPKVRKQRGLGSGAILTPDGYIITNYHVVGVADEIKVSVNEDTKKEYDAKVIGKDEATDLALIKIDAKNLPTIELADSDKVEVGDVVLAIGNPFGVGKTVTMGIVSALGRDISAIDPTAHIEDFIQTDASINPGNSGGPLVDYQGRMIGLNTAIASTTGSNAGIGFAIPSNVVASVRDALQKQGHITRGYLGVKMSDLTPDVAKELKVDDGALVGEVVPGSAADEAKIEPGDVITEFNGRHVSDNRTLSRIVKETPPGKKVPVKVIRDGKEKALSVTLKELTDKAIAGATGNGDDNNGSDSQGQAANQKFLPGVEIDDFDDDARKAFSAIRYPAALKGAVVTSVADDSPAAPGEGKPGLQPGDVILEAQHKDVRSAKEALAAVKGVKGNVLLRVWSRGGPKFVVVKADGQ
ncbi:MAG TPA: Do family serine endopeptidase [Candidatus Methylacidiphilales bacterium]